MAISSSLSLGRISKSASGLNYVAKQTTLTTTKLSRNISSGIEQKRRLGSSLKLFKKRRIDTKNRKFLVDRLKTAPSLVTRSTGPRSLAATDKSTNLMDRMLGFVGYTAAGWALSNLPTWITLGEQFTKRVLTASSILSNYGDETLNVITDLNKVFKSTFVNLSKFDFTDNSNLIGNSLDELKSSLDDLGTGLSDAFAVFLKPFGYVPPLNQPSPYPDAYENPPTPPPGGDNNQTKASYGTKEQRAMLDAIAWAEGGVTYRTMFGGDQFDTSKGWKHPDKVVRSGGYASTAAGRYQFLTPTWNRAAKALGLKDFSPINQDKAAIYLMNGRLGGDSAEILRKEGVSNRVLNAFSGEWAAIPNASGNSTYRQPVRRIKAFKDKYDSILKTTPDQLITQTTPQPQPQRPLSGTNLTSVSGRGVTVPVSPFKSGFGAVITSLMGLRWGKEHKGYDLAANQGTPLYAYLPGVVTHENRAPGSGPSHGAGYGYWIVWKDDVYGSYHFYGHLMKPAEVKKGDRFQQGALLGYVGSTGHSTGPHLHWEISNNAPDSLGNFTNRQKPDVWLNSHPVTGAKPLQTPTPDPKPTTPLVPLVTPSAQQQNQDINIESNQNQFRDGIVQERRGQKIIIIDDRGTPESQTIVSSGGGQNISIEVDKHTLLNNFIKNKLLLDLAYL